jgi:tetratricopeptide (TPR) repeat protein
MIIEQHYDEEVLAEFLGESGDAETRDKHLANCSLCQRTLASLRTTAQTLTQPAVWDNTPLSTAPRPETLAFLRGMQKSMADEDALAAVWIKQLLAGTRETWAPRLAEHPEWRTGGMVRRLLDRVEGAINTAPEDGVEISALAAQIAEKLGNAEPVRRLFGAACYHHAYSLWYTGATNKALEVLNRAEESLREVSGAEIDLARATMMRAMVYETLERRDDALRLANEAAAVFAQYGDVDRHAAARSAAAIILQSAQRLREALAIHAGIAHDDRVAEKWRVSAVHNMAICQGDLGDFEAAAACLVRAIQGYESLGMFSLRSKTRWALAQVFAQRNQHRQALSLFMDVRSEFEELGMANDVALLSLEMCESLLALGLTGQIIDVCRAAMTYFERAGLARTEPALRGVAYLHEAAAAGRATPAAIDNVRAFLLAPSQPTLLFAELPQ